MPDKPLAHEILGTPARTIDYSAIEFTKSASHISNMPSDTGTEIAFMGRSNAGKSSAINVICNQNRLARTSKTPGRTQLINFFEITDEQRLVDLPGYGYAKVPEKIKQQIQHLLNSYLEHRFSLAGIILLMDIRHPLSNQDLQLIDITNQIKKPVHILLTKCDKLKRGASNNQLLKVRKQLQAYPLVTAQTFSSLNRFGLDEARDKIESWLEESN